jgi:hypothetical protein
MGVNKTIDGLNISKIVNALSKLHGISFRQGTKHFLVEATGMRPCPVGPSTDAKKMLAPWVAKATGYDKNTVYSSLRSGQWYN